MIFGVDLKPTLESVLEHHGVKGMRWGVRRDPRNVASRAKDRAARKRSTTVRDKQIDEARTRLRSGETRRTFKDAKKQFKVDKKELGRREARKRLYKARLNKQNDIDKANMIKSGAETTGVILGIVGTVGIRALLNR